MVLSVVEPTAPQQIEHRKKEHHPTADEDLYQLIRDLGI